LGEQSEANAAKRKELIQAIEMARREAQKSLSVCEKSGFELIEFEESVTKEKGCWLKFVKFPIPTNT
jgi:endo-alpha-1,4-polygalactosaminidase (GH114 family)